MKHRKLVVLTGLVTAFFITAVAFAQGGGECDVPEMGCPQLFAAMDANQNGKVSKAEFLAAPPEWNNTEQKFQAMDVKKHGYLTKDEFCSSKGMRMEKGKSQGKAKEDCP